MAKAYKITEEISNEIRIIRRTIKNKNENTRLHAVELRGLGKKNKEISEILDVYEKVVSKWISIFSNQGIQGLMNKPIRLMFKDEASFGRINKSKYCWCNNCHHIREYRYTFGAVEPLTGERFFLVLPNCNTNNMNIFLKKLFENYSEDIVILVCDEAAWHKSKALKTPENIIITIHHIYWK